MREDDWTAATDREDLLAVIAEAHDRIPARRRRRFGWDQVMLLMIVFLIAGVIGATLTYLLRPSLPKAFDPLSFPVQTVSDTIPGVNGPAVHLGADVHVQATKCNNSSQPVAVSSVVSWSTVDGTQYDIGHTTGSYPVGCTAHHFTNPTPAVVVERTRELFAQGRKEVTWRIIGTITPSRSHAVTRVWTTENFEVVP